MIKHQNFLGGNNGGKESFPQEQPPSLKTDSNDSSFQCDNMNRNPNPHPHRRPRNPEVNPTQKVNLSMAPPNRGTTHIFYKTRMCQKFLEGNCRNGDSCTFAHGSKDLREPPPNWQELVKDNRGGGGGRNWNDDQKIIQRMKICRKFYNGEECPYGEKCNFLHESPAKFKGESAMEMERPRESLVINTQTVGPNVDRKIGSGQTEVGQTLDSGSDAIQVGSVSLDQDALRASVKSTFWKTRICSKWEVTGQCIFADKCHFAHGLAELHTPVGRVEGEGYPYAASSVPSKAPITDIRPADSATGVSGQEGEAARGIAKWKLAHKKLNRIYADWIDDEEEDQVSSSKVEY